MTGSHRTERCPWTLLLAAAVLAAAARALLIGAKDGYAAMGLYHLASRSAARHFFEGLGACVAVGVACGVGFRLRRIHAAVRFAATACLAVLAYLFITGRIPTLPPRVTGLHGLRAKVAQVGAALAAVTTACMLPLGGRLGPIVARLVAGIAGLLTAAAATAMLVPIMSSERAGPAGTRSRPNVILISLDTVRADHLGCYGHPQPTTPEIDRFFSHDAVRFATAFAPQPWTLTSHMTMLTSLHPSVHGVIAGRSLPAGVPTLAEILRDEGYANFGYVYDVPWMQEHYGFDRGFHRYRRFPGSAASRKRVVDTLLDDLASERFFLFLHYFDAHSDWGGLPYESDPVDRTAFTSWYHGDFAGTDRRGRSGTDLLWGMNQDQESLPEEVRRYVTSLYDAGLRGLDRALGDLFRDLEARGLLANTIVVLTADHGEEFEEHGKFLHTQAYDECVHVPLLFRVPAAGGVRACDDLVGLMDLAPTILDLCGITIPAQMQGHSLRPLIAGEDDPADRSHLLLMDEEGHLALRTDRWKLITSGSGQRLHDLDVDPGERRDLAADAATLPAVNGLMRMLEEEERKSFALRAKVGIADARGVSLSESEIKKLKALGYLVEDS